jgi:hypothetical protein
MSASGVTGDGRAALLELPYPSLNAMFADIDIEDTTSAAAAD